MMSGLPEALAMGEKICGLSAGQVAWGMDFLDTGFRRYDGV